MDDDRSKTAKTEKRRFERQYLAFYLRVFDGKGSGVVGHLVNISSQGMMLLCEAPIAVNEPYRQQMQLPVELVASGAVIFDAVCRWCRRNAQPGFYLTGFHLQGITNRLRDDILALVDAFGSDG